MRSIDSDFSSLFKAADKAEDKARAESGGEGAAREDDGGGGKPTTYDWLNLVEAVSETTRFDFDKVFESPVRDFIAYLAYINEKRSRERAEVLRLKGSTSII